MRQVRLSVKIDLKVLLTTLLYFSCGPTILDIAAVKLLNKWPNKSYVVI